jgi:hypothetical protein
MLRSKVALAAALVAGCSIAYAGDFVPRVGSNALAAIADDPGARSAPSAAMSESDSCPTEAAPATPSHASPARRAAARVGADEVAAERSTAAVTAASTDDDKAVAPAPARKAHALRWQSLLPGVMK